MTAAEKLPCELVLYRALARERHPDSGGSHEAMLELNAAREAALREVTP